MTEPDLLRDLALDLPTDAPDTSRTESVRARLLLAASSESRAPRRRGAFVGAMVFAGAAAAAAIGYVALRGHDRPEVATSSPPAAPPAIPPTNPAPPPPAAPAILANGSMRVHGGRVQTGNATIEGAGEYDVRVSDNALASVEVHSGTARVTVDGHEHPIFLSSGERWQSAPVRIEPVEIAPKPAPAPTIARPAPAPVVVQTDEPPADAPKPAATSLSESHFRAGWALLRANHAREAAIELAAAADANDGPLAADARYFEAVALAQSSQPAAAERALVAFLDHAPDSLRRGRAAVMLGRLIAARGDAAAARPWFESALRDPDAEVVAAARAGLAK